MKPKIKKRIFFADKISGLEAVNFTISAIVDAIAQGNRQLKFKFPFWAFSVPVGSNHGTEWIIDRRYKEVTDRILASLKTRGGLVYFRDVKRRISLAEKKFEKSSQKLRAQLRILSDRELISAYQKFIKEYNRGFGLGGVTFLYEANISEKLMASLVPRYPQASALLPQLLHSSYRSFMFLSEKALARLKKEKNLTRRGKLREEYANKYFYLRTNYGLSPQLTDKYINEQLKNLSPALPSRQPALSVALKPEERRIIELLKITEAIRDKRKQINLIGCFLIFRFLEEASRRRQIPRPLAERAYWFEYPDLLVETKKMSGRLKQRRQTTVIFDGKKQFYFAYEALREFSPSSKKSDALAGTPAAAGLYRGKIRKVLVSSDFLAFKKGEIMVARMTRPEFLPVMKKAGAIITDEGGLTSHAAIVARELGIPCIVGTKDATYRLKNGSLVEVDANQGLVKIIKL